MARILVVDDDAEYCQKVARLLRHEADFVDVRTATCGDQARRLVAESVDPFDIFLLDLELHHENGIELMRELFRISPTSDAVIFTGRDKGGNRGFEAYEAGALRYLAKPVPPQEVVWVLRTLGDDRRQRRERFWHGVLAHLAEEAAPYHSVADVARQVVKAVGQLGFERARLWRLVPADAKLVGVAECGNEGLSQFDEFGIDLAASPYAGAVISGRDPCTFRGRDRGISPLDEVFASEGFQPPKGEWAYLPLWVEGQCFGLLALDYAGRHRELHADDRRLLSLLSRQCSTLLWQASAMEERARRATDLQVESQRHESDLSQLRSILDRALEKDASQGSVAEALLHASRQILKDLPVDTSVALREWQRAEPPDTDREVLRCFDLSEGALRDGGIEDATLPASPPADDIAILHDSRQLGALRLRCPLGVTVDGTTRDRLALLTRAGALALVSVQRRQQIQNALHAATAIMDEEGLQGGLAAMVRAIPQIAPGMAPVTVWYRDPESGQLLRGPCHGLLHPDEMGDRVAEVGGSVHWFLDQDKAIWATDIGDVSELARGFVKREGIASCAALPLHGGGQPIGAVFFNYRQSHDWTADDYQLLPLVAQFLAVSVRDAGRLDAAAARERRLLAALQVAEAVGGTVDLTESLAKVLGALAAVFEQVGIAVLSYDAVSQELRFEPASAMYYPMAQRLAADIQAVGLAGPSIASRVARQALATERVTVVNVGEVADDPEYLMVNPETHSQLSLSLMSGDSLLGVLVLESPRRHRFTSEDVRMIEGLAPLISVAIDRARRSEQIKRAAMATVVMGWTANLAHELARHVADIRYQAYRIAQAPDLPADVAERARAIDARCEDLLIAAPQSRDLSVTVRDRLVVDEWLPSYLADQLRDRRPEGDIRLVTELDCPGVAVCCPMSPLRQVLVYLVRQAIALTVAADPDPRAWLIRLTTRRLTPSDVEISLHYPRPRETADLAAAQGGLPAAAVSDQDAEDIVVRTLVETTIGGEVRRRVAPDGGSVTYSLILDMATDDGCAEGSGGA